MTVYDILEYSKEEVEKVVNNIENYYFSFPIKKSSGKLRWIDAPQEPLKDMQNKLLKNFLYKFRAHPCAYGFIKNRSVKDGAKRHLGNKTLLCVDITNFFNSITVNEVYRLLSYLFSISKEKIVYTSEELDYLVRIVTYKGSLPQGSPASPALANLFCLDLDKKLSKLAKEKDLIYTRYADDISFSSKEIDYLMFRIIPDIAKELKRWGLQMNPEKTRVLRPHKRMIVTGVVVNEKLGTPKWVWRNLRAMLHNHLLNNKPLTRKEYEQVRGKIEWIKTLHPNRGQCLLESLGKLTLID